MLGIGGIIIYNLYIILGFSSQLGEIYHLKRGISNHSNLIAQLQEEKQQQHSVLSKNDQMIVKVTGLKNNQQLLSKTLEAIASEKKPNLYTSRKSPFQKPVLYKIKEMDKKNYRNTSLVELDNHLGQIKKFIAEESKEQQVLLDELLSYKWKLDHTPSIWPVDAYVTSSFGKRFHPVLKYDRQHVGIDLGATTGTKVIAAAAGVVSFAGWRGGYGYAVIINHNNGFQTLYAHNSRLLIREGQQVSKGQLISFSGSTGITTGPHLHYEVYLDRKPVNPMPFLKS